MFNPRNLHIPYRLIPYGLPYSQTFTVRCNVCSKLYPDLAVICYNVNPAIYGDESADKIAAHAAYPVQIVKFDADLVCSCLAPSRGSMMVFYTEVELN